MADVTKMLEKDHRGVARLFREIKKTNGAARRKLVDQLTADLRLHMKVEKLSPSQPGFDGALAMLEAGIKHHVREEEDEVFPKFRKSADADELNELGTKVAAAKERAGA
jgi:hemerythrin-like domain-containing protein